VQVEINFETSKETKTLRPKVMTKFSGLSIPYNLPNEQKDGCKHLKGTRCPLDKGEDSTYVLTMPILKIYPSIKIEIQLELFADENESQFCFKIDCEVVN
jgi:hypothetical protein